MAIDLTKLLKRLTGVGGWKQIDGPDTRCGVDYWFKSGGHEAYINIDQDHMTITADDDVVHEGDVLEK